MDTTTRWLGIETTVWVAIIGAMALIAVTLLQNYFSRRREDHIRTEADDRAEREAARVAHDREQQRVHDLELARQRRKDELSDAWRMTRLEAYRDLRSLTGRAWDELIAIERACKRGQGVPEPSISLLSDDTQERWWSTYSEVRLLGSDRLRMAAEELSRLMLVAESQVVRKVREFHGLNGWAHRRRTQIIGSSWHRESSKRALGRNWESTSRGCDQLAAKNQQPRQSLPDGSIVRIGKRTTS